MAVHRKRFILNSKWPCTVCWIQQLHFIVTQRTSDFPIRHSPDTVIISIQYDFVISLNDSCYTGYNEMFSNKIYLRILWRPSFLIRSLYRKKMILNKLTTLANTIHIFFYWSNSVLHVSNTILTEHSPNTVLGSALASIGENTMLLGYYLLL